MSCVPNVNAFCARKPAEVTYTVGRGMPGRGRSGPLTPP
jgi:hypothetical protein